MSAIEKQETSAEVTRVAGSDSQGNGSLSDEGKVEAQLDSPEPPSEAPKPPERKIHGVSWALVVLSVLSSIFVYSLDNTIVADVTPSVVNDFGDSAKLPWLSVGFLLGGAATVLPFGKLYGLFDAKWLYITSSIVFNVGSAVCGAAPNMNALIIGRVLAGIGGNGMFMGVMNLMSGMTTPAERPGYLSFVGVAWGIGSVLGPVVGGAFAESSATWRWAFYLNLCVSGVCAPVYFFLIPSQKPQADESCAYLIRQFDFVGTLFSLGAITSLVMGINLGGTLYDWNSGQIIALFVVSGVLFLVFGLQQSFAVLTTLKNRLFPCHFLRNHNAVMLFACASAVNTAGFIPIYYTPLYFQFTRGDSAIEAAVRLLPLILVLSAGVLSSGHLMGRFSYFQPWYVFGSAIALIGGVLMSRITPETPTASIYGFEILLGIGTGVYIQAGFAVIQFMVDPADRAYAISYMRLGQLGGIAMGLAVAGAVFVNVALSNLQILLPDVPRSTLQLAITGTSGAYFKSLSEDLQEQSTRVIVSAIGKTFIFVYVGAAVSLVLSILFTQRKLYKAK